MSEPPSTTVVPFSGHAHDERSVMDPKVLDLLGRAMTSVRDITLDLLAKEEPYKEMTTALRELIGHVHATFQSHDQRTAVARQTISVLNEMHGRLVETLHVELAAAEPAEPAEPPESEA